VPIVRIHEVFPLGTKIETQTTATKENDMKKMLTISTVVSAALIACSGIAAAKDYTINWQKQLGDPISCSLVQAQAYSDGVLVATADGSLTTNSKNLKLSVPTSCSTIKLSASCSYSNSGSMVNFTPEPKVVSCVNGIATVTMPQGSSSGSITFLSFGF